MTYDLRGLRLHGLIQHLPDTNTGSVALARRVTVRRDCPDDNPSARLLTDRTEVGVRPLPLPARCDRVAIRWYLRFGLSYRDAEELLAERGVEVDHVSIYQWVLRFTPLLAEAARPCRHAVGDRWQVDET
jgi:hypothetical protein